jgi:hypothetical protein
MKCYNSALLLLFCLLGSATTAQSSLTVSHQYAAPYILDGIEFPTPPMPEQELQFHATIENTGPSAVALSVFRVTLSAVANHTNHFCVGPSCYPEYMDTSDIVDTVYMEPGHVETTFSGRFNPNEVDGISYVKYCFYNRHNIADSTCLNVVYHIVPIGIREATNITAQLGDIYPNPSSSSASFAYMIEGTPSKKEFVIHDMIGNLITAENLKGFQGLHHVSTENFNAGIYMLSVRLDGVIAGTKRLVVER